MLSVLGVVIFQSALGALLRVPLALWRTERAERRARGQRQQALEALSRSVRDQLLGVPLVLRPLESAATLSAGQVADALKRDALTMNPDEWAQLSAGLRAQAQAVSAAAGAYVVDLPSEARQAVTRAIEGEQFASTIAWAISQSLSDLIAQRLELNLLVVDRLRETMKIDRARLATTLGEVADAVSQLETFASASNAETWRRRCS